MASLVPTFIVNVRSVNMRIIDDRAVWDRERRFISSRGGTIDVDMIVLCDNREYQCLRRHEFTIIDVDGVLVAICKNMEYRYDGRYVKIKPRSGGSG